MPITHNAFDAALAENDLGILRSETAVGTLQVNVGKLCNQACHHCHVEAGPLRTEIMTLETVEQVLQALRRSKIPTLDITGGAPELNPHFETLVTRARQIGVHVMVRHNFTVQFTTGKANLPEFFREHQVEVIASLPCYTAEMTDAQRGKGVFAKSLEGMRRLNAVGYGREGTGLLLNLVFNPPGLSLPPDQAGLEADFRHELKTHYGLEFNRLFTITNMPIRRFLDYLHRSGNYAGYMETLIDNFNPNAVPGLMCRTLLSVGWDGQLYDCDFNQMLDLTVEDRLPRTIADLDIGLFAQRRIVTGNHCFGCTAGAGSSCGGTIAK